MDTSCIILLGFLFTFMGLLMLVIIGVLIYVVIASIPDFIEKIDAIKASLKNRKVLKNE